MGTRSLTIFKGLDGEEICVLYRQFDGYLKGHGAELVDFLRGKQIVNGFGRGMSLDTHFNGMECLTAAVIAHFKTEIGNFYVYPAGTRNAGEEFVYSISADKDGKIEVKVLDIYSAKVSQLLPEKEG